MNGVYGEAIDQYVPEGVVLTEIQQRYLNAVVELFGKQEKVRMIDVARKINKSTGTINSAIKILAVKGILDTNKSGTITLLRMN